VTNKPWEEVVGQAIDFKREKMRICLFCKLLRLVRTIVPGKIIKKDQKLLFFGLLQNGWGGRIRTSECRYQKPVP
jgi:hypothetical protein